MLEYFSSTHGARKGLADTALKTADSGYLTRKLADVAQNVVITMEDCGTTQGITKGVIYRGEKVEVAPGRVDPRPRQPGQHRQPDHRRSDRPRKRDDHRSHAAQKLEELGLEKIQVRSPMTCDAVAGHLPPLLRHGPVDRPAGRRGHGRRASSPPRASASRAPSSRCGPSTSAASATRGVEEKDIKAKREGMVKFTRLKVVVNDAGQKIVLTRNGEIQILDPKGRELEKYEVPAGASLMVEESQKSPAARSSASGTRTASRFWPKSAARSATRTSSRARRCGSRTTPRATSAARSWSTRATCTRRSSSKTPRARSSTSTTCPKRPTSKSTRASMITAGTLLAKTPREVSGTQDITGGLPRVTEIFEARKPKEPAVIAEIDGRSSCSTRSAAASGRSSSAAKAASSASTSSPHGKHLRVHAGDRVRAGEALVDGPLVPHDILRISGEEAVQHYLLREIQNVYRSQRVEIDDKHIEIIVAQMLRKVRVEASATPACLPGSVIDKFEFRGTNQELMSCVKIKDPGDTDFARATSSPRDALRPGEPPGRSRPAASKAEWIRPKPATASTQLLGITKAAVQSDSFISAASFQETTKVLTEAALAGKVDYLVGLKENVILGHLVPAGTGFKTHQEAEVRIRPEALEALAEKGPGYSRYPKDEAVGRRPARPTDRIKSVTFVELRSTARRFPHKGDAGPFSFRKGDSSLMATVTTRIGPADIGRKMTWRNSSKPKRNRDTATNWPEECWK